MSPLHLKNRIIIHLLPISSYLPLSLCSAGIEDDLVALLGAHSPIPVTYAGGVRSIADLERVKVRPLFFNVCDC